MRRRPAESRPPLRRLGPILASLSLVSMGIGLTEPVIPLYALELGATPFIASVIVAVRWGSRLLTNVPAGAYSDRHGRRSVAIVGAIAILAAGAVAAAAPNWQVLLLSRLLEGLGVGALMTAILAMVTDETQADVGQRARVFGHHQTIQRIGFWWGPTIGAALYGVFNARTVVVICTVLVGVGAWFTTKASETLGSQGASATRDPRSSPRVMPPSIAILRRPAFLLGSLIALGSFFTLTGTQFTALPLYIVDVRDFGTGTLSLAMFLINAVGFTLLYPSAWLADRYGRPPAILGLAVMAIMGLVGLGMSQTAIGLLASSMLLGGATAMRGPALQAFAMDLAEEDSVGSTAGMFRALGDLGSALGPLGVGLAAQAGYTPFFFINAGVLFVVSAVFAAGTAGEWRRPLY